MSSLPRSIDYASGGATDIARALVEAATGGDPGTRFARDVCSLLEPVVRALVYERDAHGRRMGPDTVRKALSLDSLSAMADRRMTDDHPWSIRKDLLAYLAALPKGASRFDVHSKLESALVNVLAESDTRPTNRVPWQDRPEAIIEALTGNPSEPSGDSNWCTRARDLLAGPVARMAHERDIGGKSSDAATLLAELDIQRMKDGVNEGRSPHLPEEVRRAMAKSLASLPRWNPDRATDQYTLDAHDTVMKVIRVAIDKTESAT